MSSSSKESGFLALIERIGNKLPDPIMLFVGATVLVMALSAIGSWLNWSVEPVTIRAKTEMVVGADGVSAAQPVVENGRPVLELVKTGATIAPRSLLSADGAYWLIANMVRNFINFAPLGVVLVGVLGIGVAEKFGMFGGAMRWIAGWVPSRFLTPTVIFLGLLSHVAGDSGYVVLPALAGGLFMLFGRPPIAGIAAAFAGVAGGFSTNILISPTDALIAPITQTGARVLDANYTVQPTCNYYFLMGSSVLLTLTGWFVTSRIVEPRCNAIGIDADAKPPEGGLSLSPQESRALRAAGLVFLACIGGIVALIAIPGAPLNGVMPAAAPTFGPIPSELAPNGAPGVLPRWSQAIVPLIFVLFLLPGAVYGRLMGVVKSVSDVSDALVYSMKQMSSVIVMCFFAAQFIECFKYSRLDVMVAYTGGELLAAAGLPTPILLTALIVMSTTINLLISSMSAKWTFLAPVVVPMMMMSGLSPELVQGAYRVGDSCTNVLTPLNAYMVIILVAAQRFRKDFGLGSVVALMLPYTLAFLLVWTVMLLLWVWLGIPMGPGGPLWYTPAAP